MHYPRSSFASSKHQVTIRELSGDVNLTKAPGTGGPSDAEGVALPVISVRVRYEHVCADICVYRYLHKEI